MFESCRPDCLTRLSLTARTSYETHRLHSVGVPSGIRFGLESGDVPAFISALHDSGGLKKVCTKSRHVAETTNS